MGHMSLRWLLLALGVLLIGRARASSIEAISVSGGVADYTVFQYTIGNQFTTLQPIAVTDLGVFTISESSSILRSRLVGLIWRSFGDCYGRFHLGCEPIQVCVDYPRVSCDGRNVPSWRTHQFHSTVACFFCDNACPRATLRLRRVRPVGDSIADRSHGEQCRIGRICWPKLQVHECP